MSQDNQGPANKSGKSLPPRLGKPGGKPLPPPGRAGLKPLGAPKGKPLPPPPGASGSKSPSLGALASKSKSLPPPPTAASKPPPPPGASAAKPPPPGAPGKPLPPPPGQPAANASKPPPPPGTPGPAPAAQAPGTPGQPSATAAQPGQPPAQPGQPPAQPSQPPAQPSQSPGQAPTQLGQPAVGQMQMQPGQPAGQMPLAQHPGQMQPSQPPRAMQPSHAPAYPSQPPGQMYPSQPPGQVHPSHAPRAMQPSHAPMHPSQPPGQMYPSQAPAASGHHASMPPGHHASMPPGHHASAAPGYPQQAQAGGGAGGGLNKNVIIAGAVGGGALLVIGIVAVVLMSGGGALPVDHGNLPSETRSITRWKAEVGVADAAGVLPGDVPEEAYWARLSSDACGGYDLYTALMDSPLKYGRKYAAKMLARKLENHTQALKCGKEMAESMGSGPRYWVTFSEGDKRREVMLLPNGPEKLPDPAEHFKTASDPSNMEDTHCLVPWDREKSDKCSKNAASVARLDKSKVWVKGRMKSLKEFGSEYDTDGGNASGSSERLAEMASRFSGWDRAAVGTPEGFVDYIPNMLGARVSMYDTDERKELMEAIEDGAKVWAFARRGSDDGREMKLVIVAKRQSAAKEIKSALKEYHSKLKDVIDDRNEKDEDVDRDEDEPEKYLDFIEARRQVARRALKKAEIEIDGEEVVFVAEEQPKEGELKKIRKYRKWRAELSELTVKVMADILKGDEPNEGDLDKLGGDELLEMLDIEKKIARGDWPHGSVSFPGMSDFKVPGGGKWVTKSITGNIKLSMFEYKEERDKVAIEFQRLAKADGWTVNDTGEHSYELRKGSKKAKFALGQKISVSTLILISSNF